MIGRRLRVAGGAEAAEDAGELALVGQVEGDVVEARVAALRAAHRARVEHDQLASAGPEPGDPVGPTEFGEAEQVAPEGRGRAAGR